MLKKAYGENSNWRKLVAILIFNLIFLSIFSFFINLQITNYISSNLEEQAKSDVELFIEEEVNSQYDKIAYSLEQIKETEKKIIKTKIQSLAANFQSIPDIMSYTLKQRQDIFMDLLETIDKNDAEYLYFALYADGTTFRSGTDEKYDGTYVADFADADGFLYLAEGLKAVNQPDGIYVTYHWPKVKDGVPLKKTSYFYYIPEIDIVVGTGSYDEDIEQTLRESTYRELNNYYKNNSFYLFVIDYSGNFLVHQDQALIGQNILTYNSGQYEEVHTKAMKTFEESSEGFISYSFYQAGGQLDEKKETYIKSLDQWGAYMGMGYYLNNLEAEVESSRKYFVRMLFWQIGLIVFLLLLTSVMTVHYLKKLMIAQRQQLENEELVFTKLFQLSREGIVIVSKEGKTLYSNRIAKVLLGDNDEKFFDKAGNINLEEVFDDIFLVDNKDGIKTYLSYTKTSFKYLKSDTFIYLLHDETDYFLKTEKLKNKALYDSLTAAANRRKFDEDMSNLFSDAEIDTFQLAIIDIDYFKSINDTFGHDVGDKILKLLVRLFLDRLRDTDTIYRYGGDEFIVILKHITTLQAKKIISVISEKFKAESKIILGKPSTLSIGLLEIDMSNNKLSVEKCISAADQLLYKAKENGRDCIATASDK